MDSRATRFAPCTLRHIGTADVMPWCRSALAGRNCAALPRLIHMNNILLVATAVLSLALVASADASVRAKRDQARADCERQANAMQLAHRTVMRRNFIHDCMIDRGFQGR